MRISYPKDMRARAEAEGKTLATIDCETDGVRYTSQGPASEAQARFALWCSVAMTVLSERQLVKITRDIKKKVERVTKRRKAGGSS